MRTVRTRLTTATVAAATAGLLLAAACGPGNIVHSYKSFQSAIDRGASCSELYDQKARYTDKDTLAKMDRDLKEIGCTSRHATRTDRD